MPKAYCPLHGLAHLDKRGCPRCNPVPFKHYTNLVLLSATQLRLSSSGEPMPGIFEVISEHIVNTPEHIAGRRIELEHTHAARML